MIHNRKIALVFRGFSLAFVAIGLATHLNLFQGTLNLKSFMYYTIQSNLLALVLFALLFAKTIQGLFRKQGTARSASYFPRFEMVCVVDLLLTLVVYWVLLAPGAFSMGTDTSLWTFDNLSVHLITPLLCLIDYLLFAETGHLKYKDVYAVTIFPLCYVAFTSVAGLLGYVYRISSEDGLPVRFPYFFFDYDRVGLGAIAYIGALVVVFLIVSHIIYWIDKNWKKPALIPEKQATGPFS